MVLVDVGMRRKEDEDEEEDRERRNDARVVYCLG